MFNLRMLAWVGCLGLSLVCSSGAWAEAELFPDKQRFHGQTLLLNGKGVRTKLLVDLYMAGLYLQVKNSDSVAIVNGKQPWALRIEIVSDLISSEKMAAAVHQGFQHSGGDLRALQTRIAQLINVFQQPIAKGDVYDFFFQPQNTHIIKNGQQIVVIEGADFSQAFLNIWLGERPVQSSLKDALLGQTQ